MRFSLVEQLADQYPVRLLCRTLGVSTSGYYARKHRDECDREREDLRLRARIRAIFRKKKKVYGTVRIRHELRKQGVFCGRKRIRRLMRRDGLQPIQQKKFRATTDSKHDHPVAENLLNRRFDVTVPNTVWLGDITCVWTWEGWLYLAAVLDLASRKIVGWSMDSRMPQELTLDALKAAYASRRPAAGLLHHTDRGSQYTARAYRKLVEDYGMVSSMSRRGDCWDNAPMESFFHSLKTECLHHRSYRTREEARAAVFEYIECFYNTQRSHSSLDYRSPAEYEAEYFSTDRPDFLRNFCGNSAENAPPDPAHNPPVIPNHLPVEAATTLR